MCISVQIRNSHILVSGIFKNARSGPIVSTHFLTPLNITKGSDLQTLKGRCLDVVKTKYEVHAHVFCVGFIFVHDLWF